MDIFKSHALTAAGPATDMLPVTPHDTADLAFPASALYVETGGTLVIRTIRNETRTVVVGDLALLPVGVRGVLATGTTAGGIHALVVA
ncbi:spike base protein, RCAP_Rcc01079 family [Roseinatronobacter sp. NSM]|uniref:spike base protein, RCAP_Rcc01079 family n=1 Tax=Roseinatronobacter sp. NSM TaxID=3457785 RepID=UPI0040352E2E